MGWARRGINDIDGRLLMCGIGGALNVKGQPVPTDSLLAMTHALHHRGPDESSVWSHESVGFAHTRLSIIDLAASHQPMHAVDGSWTLVFNGEIFNYRDLRRELDYPFTTDGDTEIILAGLVLQGIDFVKRLRGQFAFAAYAHGSGTLHLVRDRLGVLPLYYQRLGDAFVFASEVKAIHRFDPARKPSVDMDSLDAYLTGRSVPAPHTLFKGVSKLPPGYRCEVNRVGEVTRHRYWALPAVEAMPSGGIEGIVTSTDTAIRDAVAAALVADVPVGSYLSGGVDSSLIVAIMKELRGDAPVETFAAGFGDPRFDELTWARKVSDHVGTQHHEVEVRPEDFLSLWPKLTWHRDAPVSEPADTAVFRLAQLARERVTVVLSGEGGDELFGGYPKYRFAHWLRAARVAPAKVRAILGQAVDRRLTDRLARPRIMLRALSADSEADQFGAWFSPFSQFERRALLGGTPLAVRQRRVPAGADTIDRMLRFDVESWLPDNLLERGDRMSMAASLELRPPLLDHRLAEFAFTLPSSVKVRGGVAKWLLKEVARRYLPTEVVDRRKVGFRVPLDVWFRKGLRDAARDHLTGVSSFVGTTLDRATIVNLLERHDSGRYNEESRIWTLMSLEVWHQVCVRGAGHDA